MADRASSGGLDAVTLRDLPGWPPTWAAFYAGADQAAVGEVGTLVDVEADDAGTTLLITVDLGYTQTSGVLPVRRELAERVVAVLRAHRGRPLAEIGDAAIPAA
jgi:hypothetical protein